MTDHMIAGNVIGDNAPLSTKLTDATITAVAAALADMGIDLSDADIAQLATAIGVAVDGASVDLDADTIAALVAAMVAATLTTAPATSIGSSTTQVNNASVAAGAYSVLAPTATGGKRWALFTIKASKGHGVDFWGHTETFADTATPKKLVGYTYSGKANNSATGGDSYMIPCAGHAFIGGRVRNEDGAAAADVTVTLEGLFN